MHAAKLDSSDRLQRVRDFPTSMEIIKECFVVAPSTVVAELRRSLVHEEIPPAKREKDPTTGNVIYRYFIFRKASA
jgi:hypothetical protein